MVGFSFAYRRAVARIRERTGGARWNRTERSRDARRIDSRIRLKRLHRRKRRHRREQSLSSRPRAGANLRTLLLVKERSRIVDSFRGHIEHQSIARLTEHVAPVVASGPQLQILDGT